MSTTTRTGGYREVLALSVPIAGVQLAGVALTTTDVLMLQTLGVLAIAGGGLAMQFYNQIRTMCVGMVTASGNVIAEAATDFARDGDARHAERIRSALRASFAVGTGTGIAGALLVVALGALVLVLPVDPDVARLTLTMTLTLAPGLIPMIWLNVFRQFAVGLKRPGSLLVVTLISVVVNALLNWAFIHFAPTPTWGVAGIGLSTTLVQVFTLLAFLSVLRRDPELAPYVSIRPRRGDAPVARQLVRAGIPVSLTYGSEAAITTIAALVMGTVSPEMLAAHTVVNQIAYIVYQVCIGFSHGGSILISRARSDGPDEVSRVSRRILLTVTGYLTIIGVTWLIAGRFVLIPFFPGASDQTLHIATLLLCIAVLQQYAKGLQNVLVGLLRGLRDTTSGLKATLVGYWGIGVPALLILGLALSWEGYGVWTGLVLGFGTTALLLARTYRIRISQLR